MKGWLLILLLATISQSCLEDALADAVVLAPTPSGPVGNPYDTATFFPFLIKEVTVSAFSSMRYQQVYNASVFANVDPKFIYITVFGFRLDRSGFPWTVTNMQINLSTTQRAADDLSSDFAENVGSDDTVVFGPGRHDFPGGLNGPGVQIQLERPFRYNPAFGNLLLDVRIFNGSGPIDMNLPELDAQSSPTDETSRVWATDVTAAVASAADTTGLAGGIQLSAAPSLVIYTTGTTNTPTNYIVIDWPSQPSVFRLQQSPKLGAGAIWQTVTNATPPRYYFPLESAGLATFYRLVWEAGQPVEPAAVPLMRGTTQGQLHIK